MPTTPTTTSPPNQGVRSDVPYIKCAVCEALAAQAAAAAAKLRSEATPASPLTEVKIIDALEKLTDATTEEGEWMATIDLVEDGTKLTVVQHPTPGVCGAECKTVAMAASSVLDAVDTDLGELLWRQPGATAAGVAAWLCREATSACAKPPPPLPPTRPPGPPFEPEDEQAAQMRRTMASLKAAGMGGTLYDRASVLNQLKDEDDDDGGSAAPGSFADTEALAQSFAQADDDGAGADADDAPTGAPAAARARARWRTRPPPRRGAEWRRWPGGGAGCAGTGRSCEKRGKVMCKQGERQIKQNARAEKEETERVCPPSLSLCAPPPRLQKARTPCVKGGECGASGAGGRRVLRTLGR